MADDDNQTLSKRYTTPFGAARGTNPTTWPDDKRFLDKPVDANTGLTHIGVREYDPLTGRFLRVDPVLVTDSAQSLGGYGYANNNPVTTSDPSGACSDIDCPTRGPNGHNDTPLPADSPAQQHNTGAQSGSNGGGGGGGGGGRGSGKRGTATGMGNGCPQGMSRFCGPLYGGPPIVPAPHFRTHFRCRSWSPNARRA
ncbi:hypothetical protein ADK55_04495 [Streptomyces sp. WM4235]|nr:hypothetical protein ADK55_04495 [Streptomyces sp. WM4235]